MTLYKGKAKNMENPEWKEIFDTFKKVFSQKVLDDSTFVVIRKVKGTSALKWDFL
jgi:hypothetical protein